MLCSHQMPIRGSRGVFLRGEFSSNPSERGIQQSPRLVLGSSASLFHSDWPLRQSGPTHTTGSGPVGVFPRQARFPISAVPYFGVWLVAVSLDGTRAGRWTPLLLAKLLQELSPFEVSKYKYATSGSVSSGRWRWMPPGVVDACADAFEFLGARDVHGFVFASYFIYATTWTTSTGAQCVDSQWSWVGWQVHHSVSLPLVRGRLHCPRQTRVPTCQRGSQPPVNGSSECAHSRKTRHSHCRLFPVRPSLEPEHRTKRPGQVV